MRLFCSSKRFKVPIKSRLQEPNMLQTMRDNSKGVVAGILVGLLVIVFALSGAEALFNSRNQPEVAVSINGEDVSEIAVARAIEQQRSQLRNRFGESVPEDFLSDANLRQPALDRVIDRTLLSQAAANADMRMSTQRIDNTIVSIPAFQNASGQFDPQVFRMALQRLAYTPANYRRELQLDMTINQLVNGISQSNFATPSEILFVAELNNQLRSFEFFSLSKDDLAGDIEVTEQEVSDYYTANNEQFSVPEKVAVEFIELSVANLQDSVVIEDSLAEEQYQQNLTRYTAPVERHLAHIQLEDASDDEVAEVQAALNAGEDFAALAAQYSDDLGSKDMGGDLGVMPEGTFPDDFEAAVATLSVGEVSGPVLVDSSTHFIQLLSESGGTVKPFEEVKEQIVGQLQRATAEERFVELRDRLEDLSYNAESLATVAQELGLEVATSEPFSREGGTGITASSQVAAAAFGEEVLQYNNASEIIELAPDRVVVVKKVDHQPSYVESLETVAEQIRQQLTDEKAMALLAERGEQLVAELRAGGAIESVAADVGVEVSTAVQIQRGNMEQPRRVVEFAFSLPSPDTQPVFAGKNIADEFVVVRLSEVTVPEGEMEQEQQQAMRQALSSMNGAADFESYTNYLRETATIE